MKCFQLLGLAALAAAAIPSDCPAYDSYAAAKHAPYSRGKYKYPYQRPDQRCRTYIVPAVEETLKKAKCKIKDPDLYRLFLNSWPNTVDTTVLWQGTALDDANEELAFISTGDIHAMWLRDSANQLQSYKPILNMTSHNATNKNDIATLYRGAINLQARYINKFPYCNSFQPPADSKLPPNPHRKRSVQSPSMPESRAMHQFGKRDTVNPPYDPNQVWECKYELDSVSAFLQLSWDYYEVTGDKAFFGKYQWADAVKSILKMANDMMEGTYTEDGRVNPPAYTWMRDTTSATEVVSNNGNGNPIVGHIGLVRSFFRPSDDSTIYQYFIPANMMFSRYLKACAGIMDTINKDTASQMRSMSAGIDKAVVEYGIVKHPKYGEMYAYEVDGFGSHNFMDDANIPSLLSIPHLGFKPASDPVYKRTREFVLSRSNPYWSFGPVLNSTGGPHQGPGMAWPMATIMRAMTSSDDEEISQSIKQIMGSTSGLGVIHESVNTHDDSKSTRSWFAWANGLFGQMILDLMDRKPHLLTQSYQD